MDILSLSDQMLKNVLKFTKSSSSFFILRKINNRIANIVEKDSWLFDDRIPVESLSIDSAKITITFRNDMKTYLGRDCIKFEQEYDDVDNSEDIGLVIERIQVMDHVQLRGEINELTIQLLLWHYPCLRYCKRLKLVLAKADTPSSYNQYRQFLECTPKINNLFVFTCSRSLLCELLKSELILNRHWASFKIHDTDWCAKNTLWYRENLLHLLTKFHRFEVNDLASVFSIKQLPDMMQIFSVTYHEGFHWNLGRFYGDQVLLLELVNKFENTFWSSIEVNQLEESAQTECVITIAGNVTSTIRFTLLARGQPNLAEVKLVDKRLKVKAKISQNPDEGTLFQAVEYPWTGFMNMLFAPLISVVTYIRSFF